MTGTANARAGLLGNPSDGYEGKAIAFSMANFRARVTLEEADHFEILPGPDDETAFDSVLELTRSLDERGCYGGDRLLRAALRRFSLHWPELGRLPADDPRLRFTLGYETDIPRQVGLAGSSAIVIATLRALASWFQVAIAPLELARLALAAEVEDLGIAAGPMDRVIQASDGMLLMDFTPPVGPGSYSELEIESLPPLFVAWDPRGGEVSGKAHAEVRRRWLDGDTEILAAMRSFRTLVDEGVECLRVGDVVGLQKRVDLNFDTRASIWPVSDRDRELIALGRELGAATKFCGSGGAVVGVMRDADEFDALRARYRERGYESIVPEPVPSDAH